MTDGDADFASDRQLPRRAPVRVILLGFAVAVGLVLVLVSVVGIDDVVAALAGAKRWIVVAVFVVALGWLTAWSYTLHLVLLSVDIETTPFRSFVAYANVQFANQVTPFSVLGSTPLAALLISRATGERYETGFAVTASVELLNYLPAPALALLGLLFLAVTSVLGTALEILAVTLVGFALLAAVLGRVGWRRRRRFQQRLLGWLIRTEARLEHPVPWLPFPDPEEVDERVGAVLVTFERISRNRRVFTAGLLTSSLGWTLQATVLWLSLYAVGYAAPIEVPLLVVPLVSVTDVVPLPGGVGSVDAALVVLVVATTGVPVAVAAAAALIHRSATFLLPVVLGGAATAVVQSGWRGQGGGGGTDVARSRLGGGRSRVRVATWRRDRERVLSETFNALVKLSSVLDKGPTVSGTWHASEREFAGTGQNRTMGIIDFTRETEKQEQIATDRGADGVDHWRRHLALVTAAAGAYLVVRRVRRRRDDSDFTRIEIEGASPAVDR